MTAASTVADSQQRKSSFQPNTGKVIPMPTIEELIRQKAALEEKKHGLGEYNRQFENILSRTREIESWQHSLKITGGKLGTEETQELAYLKSELLRKEADLQNEYREYKISGRMKMREGIRDCDNELRKVEQALESYRQQHQSPEPISQHESRWQQAFERAASAPGMPDTARKQQSGNYMTAQVQSHQTPQQQTLPHPVSPQEHASQLRDIEKGIADINRQIDSYANLYKKASERYNEREREDPSHDDHDK